MLLNMKIDWNSMERAWISPTKLHQNNVAIKIAYYNYYNPTE